VEILKAELSDRGMALSIPIWLKPMPLNENVEQNYHVTHAAVEMELDAMHDLFEVANVGNVNLKMHLQRAFKFMKRLGLDFQGAYFNAGKGIDTRATRKVCFSHGIMPNRFGTIPLRVDANVV
jgi:hypothetical protein